VKVCLKYLQKYWNCHIPQLNNKSFLLENFLKISSLLYTCEVEGPAACKPLNWDSNSLTLSDSPLSSCSLNWSCVWSRVSSVWNIYRNHKLKVKFPNVDALRTVMYQSIVILALDTMGINRLWLTLNWVKSTFCYLCKKSTLHCPFMAGIGRS
jgi:hypothetical protein